MKAQRRDGKQLAKGLGVPAGKLSNEETTTWPIRWEAKSGKQAESVRRFYLPQDQGGPIDPPGGGPVVVPELEDELDKDLLRHLEPMPPRMEGESPSAYLRRINT